MLEALGVVSTARLFSGLHHHLMELLRDLTPEDSSRPTLAGSWTVRDVAVHILDGQARRLSFQRDLFPPAPPDSPVEEYKHKLSMKTSRRKEMPLSSIGCSPCVA
jgi:hypothetical protein